jgi:hypothetical protein
MSVVGTLLRRPDSHYVRLMPSSETLMLSIWRDALTGLISTKT